MPQENLPINQIIQGDLFDVLPTLPVESVDLVFADPPYNLQLKQDLYRPNMTKVDAVDDAWDQLGGFEAYDQFSEGWLSEVRRIMKPTASIWVSGTYHNIFRVGTIMQDMGFWILNTIAWYKRNAMPNFRGTRLKNDLEFVIWAKFSEESRYTFHHHLMKRFNEGKQLGSMWQIPVTAGSERLKDAEGKKLHSTQKPEELLRRIILASSTPGDLVLDPFSGSGTTAAMAKHLRRDWIGVERDDRYLAASRERVDLVIPIPEDDPLIIEATTPKPKRVPFRVLVEAGYLSVGQTLTLDKPEVEATILNGGKIAVNGTTGSIHAIGAKLKEAESCNGWMHWYYADEAGERLPLDVLRQRYRDSLG